MMNGNDKGNFRFLLEDVLEDSNAETRYRIREAYDKALARAEAAEAQTRLTEIELEHTIQALDYCQDELAALRNGQRWQPIHETLPPLGEEVQVRGRGQYVSSAWDVYLDEWRPTPPQE